MKRRQVLVLSALTMLFMLGFWLGSRYPDLSTKAEVGPEMILDGLGFEVVMPVSDDDSLPAQVGKRTVNWLKTNLKGMLFGLLIAACFQSLLQLVGARRTGNRFLDTLFGIGVGAPMGLCVNCAAPISAALYKGGSRLETSLAAMLASPTLNVIVLGFLITMLPPHLVALKLIATAILLLVVVPFVSGGGEDSSPLTPMESAPPESWAQAVGGAIKLFLKTLWDLCLKLVPLMVLAGALGSLLITAFPFQELAKFERPGLFALTGLALFGTFLPIPIAFDVIICALLYTAGMPVELVGVLLVTLGSYSIYSLTVVGQSISKRIAVQLFLAVALLGVMGGYGAQFLDEHYRNQADKKLLAALTEVNYAERPIEYDYEGGVEFTPKLKATKEFATLSPPADTLFTPEDGKKRGLEVPVVLGYAEHLTIPTVSNRSIASGDIHGDGWADIVVANDVEVGGLTLFANTGGQFVRQKLDAGRDFVTVCALVDLDGDDALDLFYATINGEVFIRYNRDGRFPEQTQLPSMNGAFVNAVGFGDIDRDGKLDMVLGTWVHRFLRTHQYRAWNYIGLQTSEGFEISPLAGDGGNCHSVLISDLDADGVQDIVLAHDSRPPDEFYRGNGTANPTQLGANVVEGSTQWTMSLDSADLNNDLNLSLFIAHIAYDNDERARHDLGKKQNREELLKPNELTAANYMMNTDLLHDRVRFGADLEAAVHSQELSPHDLPEVLFDGLISRYWRGDDRQMWVENIAHFNPHLRHLFDRVFPPNGERPKRPGQAPVYPVPSSMQANVLLEYDGERWTDQVKKWGLEYTEWSWNAKFADLNLDGFQDLFLVNGTYQEQLLNPNLLFLNQAGQTLKRVDDQGTFDYFPCSNYTYIDLDNDGDLDVVLAPQNGALRTLINNQQNPNRVGIILEDEATVIGARVLARYGETQQLKELKASGGFNSFDAPIVWFGLGENTAIDKLQIRWADGNWTEVEGPFEAGLLHRIRR